MAAPAPYPAPSNQVRAFAALLIFGISTLLATAAILKPAKEGLGTHQQLGLPPCSMRLIFGFRCPACGMTTSWSHFMRGQWMQSARSNPAGFLLAIYSVSCCFLLARTLQTGQLPSIETQKIATFALLGIAIVAFANWGIVLLRG